jgi:hypothetical protein
MIIIELIAHLNPRDDPLRARPGSPRKRLTAKFSGYTFRSAIHKDRLHRAIACVSVKSCIDDWALARLLMRLVCDVCSSEAETAGGSICPGAPIYRLMRHKSVSFRDDLRQRFRTRRSFSASKAKKRGCGGSPVSSVLPTAPSVPGSTEGQWIAEGEFLSCVLIWFLGHSLTCPIATSSANWQARLRENCTSLIRGSRTPRTRFLSASIPPIRGRRSRLRCPRPSRSRRAGPPDFPVRAFSCPPAPVLWRGYRKRQPALTGIPDAGPYPNSELAADGAPTYPAWFFPEKVPARHSLHPIPPFRRCT